MNDKKGTDATGHAAPPILFGQPHFGEEEIAAVTAVLRSGWVGMGPSTLAFEGELADWLGSDHVVSVSSCTGALFLSLLQHGIGPGDEVICPSLTWCSSANAALYLQATPVFCDIDPLTYSVTPETVRARLSPRTRAVVVVHYGGLAVDVDAIRRILPPEVAIVEDAAHALGACYPDGRRVGASGNLTCFSFYANKNLSTGEGGAIALADGAAAARLRSLRQHGLAVNAWSRYLQPATSVGNMEILELGYKLNYTDLQAAIGRVQLRRQSEFAVRRLDIARYYLSELPRRLPEARWQLGLGEATHAHHLFAVELPVDGRDIRDGIMARARNRGAGFAQHYPPLHRMPLYRSNAHLPVTEAVCDRIITFPISALMTVDDARTCLDILMDALP